MGYVVQPRASRALGEVGLSLLEEGGDAFLGIGGGGGSRHQLGGESVRSGLVEPDLGVEAALAGGLAEHTAACGASEQIVVKLADVVGSTSQMLKAVIDGKAQEYIVATDK